MQKFQIGAENKMFFRWGDNRYRKAWEMGFTHVDFNQTDSEIDLYLCSEQELKERMLHEKSLMDEVGITVSQVHGPWRWPPRDYTESDRIERMGKMKRSIYATRLLGCKYWVIHPLMPFGWTERATDPGHEQETWDINRTFMCELLTTAKENDITICIENMPMPDFSIGSPEEILRFVKDINDEHFKICLDTGHVAVYPNGNPADAARMFGDDLKVLHVHDNNGAGDWHWLPYFGAIDWENFGLALKEIGYQGVFSYETCAHIKLPDPYFENMCRMLVQIAENLLK